jgi:hypothetical protein
MRSSDVGLRRRQTKLIYLNHRIPPWLAEHSNPPGSLEPIVRSDLARPLNAYTINTVMTYDPAKRRSNKRKHQIDLADCEAAFDAPMLTREDASQDYGEQR